MLILLETPTPRLCEPVNFCLTTMPKSKEMFASGHTEPYQPKLLIHTTIPLFTTIQQTTILPITLLEPAVVRQQEPIYLLVPDKDFLYK